MRVLTIDCETPTKNKGHVFTPENFLVSYSLKVNNEPTTFHYYKEPDFLTVLTRELSLATLVVGFNIKFDLHWLRRYNLHFSGPIFDCSLAEFIYTGQEASYASLDGVLESYGLPAKQDKVKEFWDVGIDTPDIPIEILEEYNNRDVDLTYQLYLLQVQMLSKKQYDLVLLEGADMLSLIEAEANGQKWDQEAANTALVKYKEEVDAIKKTLWDFVPDEAKSYFNWDSGDDLSALLYGGIRTYAYATEKDAIYQSGEKKGQAYVRRSWFEKVVTFPQHFLPIKNTLIKKCKAEEYKGTLYYQVDDPTLKQLKTRNKESKILLENLLSVAKVSKLVEMLEELFKISTTYGWVDSLLHSQYNQNVVRTGRLSSSKPNSQNKPPELDLFLVSRYAH